MMSGLRDVMTFLVSAIGAASMRSDLRFALLQVSPAVQEAPLGLLDYRSMPQPDSRCTRTATSTVRGPKTSP